MILKELTGRTAAGSARSEKTSVAFFHLDPGCASAWSYNKVGEESFFILKGHGEVWTGDHAQAVRAGSFILVPSGVVRSVRARQGRSDGVLRRHRARLEQGGRRVDQRTDRRAEVNLRSSACREHCCKAAAASISP